jgi:hypothetical protein
MATNKRLLISKSCSNSNWCTLYRGNLIHTTCTLSAPVHICHSYTSCGQSLYMATFHESSRSTAHRLTDLRVRIQFLSHNNHWRCQENLSIVVNKLHQFTRPTSPACDQYIQYLLMGANSLVLNRHRRGLQPWRCRLFTSHSQPFPSDCPMLSPNGPARSQVINLNINL